MNKLRARHVFLGARGFLSPGEIQWDQRGIIVSVRKARGNVEDLVVLPGLVDAHVHLQTDPLPKIERQFLSWVRAVLAARNGRSKSADVAAATQSLRTLLASGTTAVGEIDSTGLSPRALGRVPLVGRCYQELTGFHLDSDGAVARIAERAFAASNHCLAGLSPHAPYSASAALIRTAAKQRCHLAIHCAEVPEEQQFLRHGCGPFAELLAQLGRLPAGYRPPGVGAVRYLHSLGVLGPRTQLIHCQELERGDLGILAATRSPIVVCPGTIEWFLRTPPPVPVWLKAGLEVAIGTDSRASNTELSMRRELSRAANFWPTLAPATLLQMATLHGARSLGRSDHGRIGRTARADFCAIAAFTDHPGQTLAAFVHGEAPIAGVWLGGIRQHRHRVEPRAHGP
jgi:cytosine/adenosine deaminase-related metal-dependent hydrolase